MSAEMANGNASVIQRHAVKAKNGHRMMRLHRHTFEAWTPEKNKKDKNAKEKLPSGAQGQHRRVGPRRSARGDEPVEPPHRIA